VVIMGCGHEDAMHTLKKRFENRRSGGQRVSPTAPGATTPCADTPSARWTSSARSRSSLNIAVVILCWHICLIFESMGHHDSEIMDDRSIDKRIRPLFAQELQL
jgi:hypothetical protein